MPPFFPVIQVIHAEMLKREIEERSRLLSAAAPLRLLKSIKEVRGASGRGGGGREWHGAKIVH